MSGTTRTRLLGSCAAAGLLLAPAAAMAQATPPAQGAAPAAGAASPDTGSAQVEEVVVTGTRIRQPNMTSISPVQVVTSQEVTLGGRTVTADFINQLPQIQQNSQAGLSSTSNPLSGPGGVATIDLRGLGQTRTLVLVDGRRLGVGDPNTGNPNPSPDINQIPSQLIDRVDVLTGGASATYGSDAIAGVVNFILRRNFEGVQVDVQESVFQHDQHNKTAQRTLRAAGLPVPGDGLDGPSWDGSLVVGKNFAGGRGNFTAYATYHEQQPITQGRRDYAACQINVTDEGQPYCAGSNNSNLFYLSSGLGENLAVAGNQFVPYSETAVTDPPALFNSNPYNYMMQKDRRVTAGYLAQFEFSDRLTLYSDFQYMIDRTEVQTAPSGLFQGGGTSPSGGFLVNCNNPLLSGQQQGALGCTPEMIAAGENVDLYIGRRNVEGQGRNSVYRHENYRVVLGARGDLFGPFRYDIYGSYYRTTLDQILQNYVGLSAIQNALQVVPGPTGPVCISGGSCVPYNIFQQGGVTPEALAYISLNGASRGRATQKIVEGTITGDLGEYGLRSPWARDGVGVAVGFQVRRDGLSFDPDAPSAAGELSGAGGAQTPIDASIKVTEGFGEVRVPIVQDRPWLYQLQMEAGYRRSHYSTGTNANTYKVGLQWAPTRDVGFRASYQKAIRAPNILELYTPQSVTNTSQLSEDPCAAGASDPAPLEQCQRTGITPAQYGVVPQCPSGQCAVLTGGNPALRPERAKTYAVGFTFTPRFARGLNASVDYYHIDLTGTIGAIPLGIVVQRCLQTGAPQFCSQIVRTSAGTLFGSSVTTGGYVSGTGVNIGSGLASGVDLQANYNLPLSTFGERASNWGDLSFSFSGSYLIDAKTTPLPGEQEYDCAGLFGPQCQTVNPRWRHTLRVNWESPWDVLFSVAWRYFGEAKLETDTNEPTIGSGSTDPFNHTLPARNYIDLSAVWNFNRVLTIRAGVNNVLDQDPPLVNALIAGTGLPNTYPSYDLLGRRLFFGVTAKF